MNRRTLLAGGTTALGLAALPSAAAPGPTFSASDPLNPPGIRMAGIRMLPVRNGRYKVWTKTIGDGPVKVLLLHGGPGGTHEYLEALESFLPQAGIQMIYYDQLGCGNSDRPDDPSLWTIERYLEEVEDVRRGLGLTDMILYGHSFGGVFAIEYALKYPQHLRGLVISNMPAGMQAYVKRTSALRMLLDAPTRARLATLEKAGAYDDPAYQKIMMEDLYSQVICRLRPWPEPLTRTFARINTKIYEQMQGKSEFEVTGNIKSWERWDDLPRIGTKALVIGSRHDEMDPADLVRMAGLMPHATSVTCPNGSHMCMWDDQAYYFAHLVPWLKHA